MDSPADCQTPRSAPGVVVVVVVVQVIKVSILDALGYRRISFGSLRASLASETGMAGGQKEANLSHVSGRQTSRVVDVDVYVDVYIVSTVAGWLAGCLFCLQHFQVFSQGQGDLLQPQPPP